MCAYLFRVFDSPTDTQKTTNQFYCEKEDTLDGVYIGTSATYRYWIPPQAYEDYGMCVYNWGTASQSISLAKFMIEDALKTQHNMKVILIELRNVKKRKIDYSSVDFRRVTDNMPFSMNRIRAIDYSLNYYQEMGIPIDYNKLDYYVPFVTYHSRWNDDIGREDLKARKEKVIYKGYVFTGSLSVVKVDEPEEYTKEAKLKGPTEKVVQDLIDYCKGLDARVIFVASPFNYTDEAYGFVNTAAACVKEEGFTVWNFNREPYKSRLNMDWSSEFKNETHANIWGAQKYTRCLSEMLHEEIDLEDHRGQRGYESWDESMKAFDKRLIEEGIRNNN
ncbi:MAG: hypothetical protein Q4A65_01850 [Bacillota bacterium]|nr:hypothetical protein [Bacillota bacterium]